MKKKNLLCFLFFFGLTFFIKVSAQVVIDTIDNDNSLFTPAQKRKFAIATDLSNNLWVGYHAGAGKWDNSAWTMYNRAIDGLPSDSVLSFAFTPTISWLGTVKGFAKLENSLWTVYDTINSALPDNYIKCLYADGSDLWIGTNRGAILFNGISFTQYSTANSTIIKDTIQCITKSNGAMWFGTSAGLSKFYGGTFSNFDSSNSGLYENNITKLVTDGNDDLWIQTSVTPGNLEFHIYYSADGNSIIAGSEEFRSCQGIPLSAILIGKDNAGKIVLGINTTYPSQSAVLSLNANAPERSVPVESWGFFNVLPGPSWAKMFALSSTNKIWMTNVYAPPFLYLYSLDYSNAYTVNAEENCYQLDANKVLARINPAGDMFFDDAMSGKYEVPAGSGKNTIQQSALWLGGLDPDTNVRAAARMYKGMDDFWSGPLDTVNATVDSLTVQQYNKVWKIHRDTIANFIYNFEAGNVGNGSYPIPSEVLDWPAHGNGNYSRSLAPFVDANNDGVYVPTDGDYPDIKGSEMLWWIFNDNYDVHRMTDSQRNLGVEVHASAYALNCTNAIPDDSCINYTTFYHYEIINRSDTDYTNFYSGIFTDADLGYPVDDYVGCDSANDFAFAYNGTNNDFGIMGYGNNPPMINCVILKGPAAGINDGIDNNHNGTTDESGEYNMMNSFMFFNDDNNPVTGNPDGANDFYDYMRSVWRNRDHLTYGGNGNGNGTGATSDSTNYMYSGEPYGNGWNESNAGNLPSERRFVSSSGPFYLPAHGIVSLDFAYVFTRNETGPNGTNTSIATNLHDVMKVKHWFETDSFPCSMRIGIDETKEVSNAVSVYPVPASSQVTIQTTVLWKNSTVELYDVFGNKISAYSFPPGKMQLTINTENLMRGFYFVKLFNDNHSATKKVIVW
jgi:hypothetical protein